ncbi:MAG: Na+/H+ antiporter subunit B [Thermodesulfobacteriota bacterium]
MSNSLILKTATRLLVSIILVFSVYLLLRGHNAPGGGFSGALVAGTGFALYAMAEGVRPVRRAIGIDPRQLIVFGMTMAILSGLAGGFAGQSFFTGLWWTVAELNNVELVVGTPFIFDIGVFAIVLGTILTLVFALESELEKD